MMAAVDLAEEIRNRKGEILRLKKEITTLEEATKVLNGESVEPIPEDDTDDE